jgi:DNA-binding PadR family transcriptional regulator
MKSPSNLVNKLEKRVIHDFMDIYILEEMKSGSLSGYDIIQLMHKRYGIMVSSGTVYSLLYSLERAGWIKGVWDERKRVYELTEKADHEARIIAKVNSEVQKLLGNILCLNATVNC